MYLEMHALHWFASPSSRKIFRSSGAAFRFYDRDPLAVLEPETLEELVSIFRSYHGLSESKRGLLGDGLASSLTCLASNVDRSCAAEGQDAARQRAAMSGHVFFLDWMVQLEVTGKRDAGMDMAKALDKPGRRKRAVGADGAASTCGSTEELLSKSVKAAATAANCDLWALFRPASPDSRLLLALTSIVRCHWCWDA